jgi:hypothetical protein
VVREIRIYIEGGGDGKDTKAALRRGFGEFLNPLRSKARRDYVRWRLVPCGSRNDAFEAFRWALKNHPQAFNVLLVDSEAPVTAPPWEHLQQRDGWSLPGLTDDRRDDHCHLMIQIMEAWLVADPEALEDFYGARFRRKALPRRRNVEEVPEKDLLRGLERATRESAKGKYHKIRHGAELLRRISADEVRPRATHCDRLFQVLEARLGD